MNYAPCILGIYSAHIQGHKNYDMKIEKDTQKNVFLRWISVLVGKLLTLNLKIWNKKKKPIEIKNIESGVNLQGLSEQDITKALHDKTSKNSKPPKKPKKINPFFAVIVILCIIFGGGYVYAKLFSNKNKTTVDTAILALEKSPIKNPSPSSVTELPKEDIPGLDNPRAKNIQTFNHTLPDDNVSKENEDSSMYKQFCNVNKATLRNNIKFIADTNYDFAYLEKKYKKNDVFSGLSRNDITVGMVYFKDANTRVIELLDSKQNKCLIDLPWHQGLEITVYFDGIDVKEKLTGNITTYLPGEKFSFVTLKTINPKEKTATFETPAGKTIYSNNTSEEDR